MMKGRAEAARLARAFSDRNNNQPPQPGIYPDYEAPVVVVGEDGQREMRNMRWGMPTSKQVLFKAATDRADKLRAKGTEFDFNGQPLPGAVHLLRRAGPGPRENPEQHLVRVRRRAAAGVLRRHLDAACLRADEEQGLGGDPRPRDSSPPSPPSR